jgi:catechol 2,3-dioxygenase-like lactoylglutathione lyase family enzyme
MFDDVTIRVVDRYASVAFYSTVLATLGIQRTGADAEFTRWGGFSVAAAGEGKIAPDAGFTVGCADAERAWFRGPTTGSFSLVAGEPTENVDIVFGTGGDVSLHVFHRNDSNVEVVHHERK